MNNWGEKVSFIWSVADLLRGPYRPPQYGRIMLPMTVLRRLDCVLEPTKEKVLDEHAKRKGGAIHAYFEREVRPHVPDAWIDESKTKVGYEIPLTRHFYEYTPPRPLEEIEADIKDVEKDIVRMLAEITGSSVEEVAK